VNTRANVIAIIVFISTILLWEGLVNKTEINEIILPTPTQIVKTIISEYNLIFNNLAVTGFESIMGFILGSIIAIILALVFTHSKILCNSLYPYAIAFKATPLIAIAPLINLWFGVEVVSKIIMSASLAFFPILVSTIEGLNQIEPELSDLMNSISASKLNVLIKVKLPSSLPFIFSGLKIGSTLSVVGAVIGEFTGASNGIGHLIITSSYYLETSLMFAAITATSLLGITMFYIISYIEKKIVFWK
jgi:NitT/TauT family transport system permease protein